MELQIVPAKIVGQAWKDGAHMLHEACEKSQGEVTADQLKLMLMRGERVLVCIVDEGMTVGWVVVAVELLPNMRALYIYQLYAPGHVSKQLFELLADMARKEGCAEIRAACHEDVSAAWARKMGARVIYTVMGAEV